jgi:hypothetical protein
MMEVIDVFVKDQVLPQGKSKLNLAGNNFLPRIGETRLTVHLASSLEKSAVVVANFA